MSSSEPLRLRSIPFVGRTLRSAAGPQAGLFALGAGLANSLNALMFGPVTNVAEQRRNRSELDILATPAQYQAGREVYSK